MLESLEKKEVATADGCESSDEQTMRAVDGTSVTLLTEDGVEKIRVRSSRGQLVFEYHPGTGRCSLRVPQGDLHFEAPAGDISLAAGGDISLRCPGNVLIQGRERVTVGAGLHSFGKTSLVMDKNQAELQGRKVSLKAEQGNFAVVRSLVRGRRLAARIDRIRFSGIGFEIVAHTIRQQTHDFYQRVENLMQINAGRLRMFVQALLHLKGKRTYIKADKDMKLKGEKIHLR